MKMMYIVDDDETYVKILSHQLKQRFKIRICPTAENCVLALDVAVPDIVIIDYFLPGMDGLELFKKLRTEYKIPKLILLSANDDSQVVLDMIRNGVREYVIKDEQVMEALMEAIGDVED